MHLAHFRTNSNELPHISALTCVRLPLLFLPAVLLSGVPSRLQKQPHLSEPDTEICAANSCTHAAQCGVIIGAPLISVSSYSPLDG